jgi:hypothetical protein
MKIHPEEAELFHEAGKTGRHEEANNRFWQFSKLAQKRKTKLIVY